LKVKPEDLKIANKVAHIKDMATGAKKHYWNGVHRLKSEGDSLILMTQDGLVWLEWHIPLEEPAVESMDVLIPAEAFDAASRHLEGGSLEISRNGGITTLERGQLHYRLREETPQDYINPKEGSGPVTWETDSVPLAKALRFVSRFIDELSPQENKNCATLYHEDSLLTGGNPRRLARVKGLKADATMSFSKTSRTSTS